MSIVIELSAGEIHLQADLYENETASAILAALPLEGSAARWGNEIYFSIPVHLDPASDARDRMQAGELAYWPPGMAFCIFWGPTPASEGDEPRAASAVNPFGLIRGDPKDLASVRDGETMRVTLIG
ncbi:MAG: cyclophilin-like fold protein [Anaerolineales bacterium]|jgi:hypothetical protein